MALLAEEIVEEWLNRQGYFTIRGAKLGVDEIDLIAIKFNKDSNNPDYRHIEVQASMRPVSYISKVPKEIQKLGKSPNSASRNKSELEIGVKEWVHRKFKLEKKVNLLQSLYSGQWTSELVINNVKSNEEVDLIKNQGINVIRLTNIISELKSNKFIIQSASGGDIIDLVELGSKIKD